MHSLYFVKIKKKEAKNADDAIRKTHWVLEENNFVSSGYWGGGKGDWYVIGGRWSGELSGLFTTGDYFDEVRKFIRSKEDREGFDLVRTEDCKKYADDIQRIWIELGGKNLNPYSRDQYRLDGYDDDAVTLTAELIDALKKKHTEGVEYFDDGWEEKDISSLSPADIGDWLVVVDYHF